MTKKNTHPNQKLIEDTLQLMALSSMEQEERAMWTLLLPSMKKEEITKLHAVLSREIKIMTDLYLRAKQGASNKK